MKNRIILSSIVVTFSLCLFAQTSPDKKANYQNATVVSVNKHISANNYLGGDSVDAPLRASDNSYDIAIRMNCDLYVGRYRSSINFVAPEVAPNQAVQILMQGHVMYVSYPNQTRQMKMGITSHKHLNDAGCSSKS